MAWLQLASYVFQLVFKIWDTVNTVNQEIQAKKMGALHDALDALAKRDKEAFTAALNTLDRI